MGIFDVPAGQLIDSIAADLKKAGIERPKWALFVKSGVNRERAPDNPDWFYVRMASVFYRVMKQGPLGTESLRSYYGGKKNRGTRKHHFRKASGKVLRMCLQGLEKQGYVKKEKKGRMVTGKGHSYLNRKAKEVAAALPPREEVAAIVVEEPRKKAKVQKKEAPKKAVEEKKEAVGEKGEGQEKAKEAGEKKATGETPEKAAKAGEASEGEKEKELKGEKKAAEEKAGLGKVPEPAKEEKGGKERSKEETAGAKK